MSTFRLTRRGALAAVPGLVLAGCAKGPLFVTHPDGTQALRTERGDVPLSGDDPTRGPEASRKVIVVFADFECPFCKQASRDLDAVMKEAKDVRLVFKHRPLQMHPRARALAEFAAAAMLAGGSEAFFRAHDRFMAMDVAPSDEDLSHFADGWGLADELLAQKDRARAKVDADVALARNLRLETTPFLFVGRRAVDGLYPYERFREIVRDELAS